MTKQRETGIHIA